MTTGNPELRITFTGNPLDRSTPIRNDPQAIADRLRDPRSRFAALSQLRPLIRERSERTVAWLAREQVEDALSRRAEVVLLGVCNDDIAYFAIDVSTLEEPTSDIAMNNGTPPLFAEHGSFHELRGIARFLPEPEASMLAMARSLLDWHHRHGFCAGCGAPTVAAPSGLSRICADEACGNEHFPRTDPVAIVLVTDGDRCLLGRQHTFPDRMVSALAGFVEPGESLEETARREVLEESGIRIEHVRYRGSQPWPFPSSLMLGCEAQAVTTAIRIDEDELEAADWYARDDVRHAIERPNDSPFFVPPRHAIAHHLIRDWAYRE